MAVRFLGKPAATHQYAVNLAARHFSNGHWSAEVDTWLKENCTGGWRGQLTRPPEAEAVHRADRETRGSREGLYGYMMTFELERDAILFFMFWGE